MRGSIQKKGKIYYVVFPFNGKRKWIRGGTTKKDAEKILAETLSEVNGGSFREIPKITFGDFADLWISSYVESNLKPSTQAGYKFIVEKHLKPCWGNISLSTINAGRIQKYIAERLKSVSAKTVVNEVVVIKEMLKHAHRWGYTKINLAEHIERPKVTKSEIDVLTLEEVKKLLENNSGQYRVAFITAVQTGLRAGELWGLQWGDIDWNSAQIHVKRSLWRGKLQTPKTKYAVRKVDISQDLVLELQKWMLACPKGKGDFVFPNSQGGASDHQHAVNRHFNPALRRAKLRKVSFHSLRHTNASIRIQAGQNIKYIQTQLGHSSVQITLDIYGHLFNDTDFNNKQLELLDSSFRSIKPSVRNPLEKPAKIEREPSKSSLTIRNHWRAVRDLNPGPLVPETNALSN